MELEKEVIGIDMGGTNIRAARISARGEILDRVIRRVPVGRSAQLAIIDESIGLMRTPASAAIGIGFPGRVQVSDGLVLTAGFLEFQDYPLGERLKQITGLPVFIDSDAYMALYAEMKLGAATGMQNVVMFTIGTGVGGALALDGKLYYGKGIAGHLGHILVRTGGELCNCGRRGCLETTSSGTALRRLIHTYGLPPNTLLEDLFNSYESGDALGREVLLQWITPMKMAIDSMISVLDPDVVLLGGGLGEGAFRALGLSLYQNDSPWFRCPVKACSLGDAAGTLGAGLRAFYLAGLEQW
jgi:glucokinase